MLEEVPLSMTDSELQHFVQDLKTQLPEVGEVLVIGRLHSMGIDTMYHERGCANASGLVIHLTLF